MSLRIPLPSLGAATETEEMENPPSECPLCGDPLIDNEYIVKNNNKRYPSLGVHEYDCGAQYWIYSDMYGNPPHFVQAWNNSYCENPSKEAIAEALLQHLDTPDVLLALSRKIGDELDEEGVSADYCWPGHDESLIIIDSIWEDYQDGSRWKVTEIDGNRVKIVNVEKPDEWMILQKEYLACKDFNPYVENVDVSD